MLKIEKKKTGEISLVILWGNYDCPRADDTTYHVAKRIKRQFTTKPYS